MNAWWAAEEQPQQHHDLRQPLDAEDNLRQRLFARSNYLTCQDGSIDDDRSAGSEPVGNQALTGSNTQRWWSVPRRTAVVAKLGRMRTAAAAGLLLASFGLAACGDEGSRGLQVVDVSGSALAPAAGLDRVGMKQVVENVEAMREGDVISIYGFNYFPGTSCEMIMADFPKQDNSEHANKLKKSLVKGIPSRFESYVQCLINVDHGYAGSGSAVFGGLKEGMVRAEANGKLSWIHLITDGCTYREGLDTCARGEMTKPGFAEKVVAQLPKSLKPDLTGVKLTVQGLGQGTDLTVEEIEVLRDVFRVYGRVTHAEAVYFK